MGKLRKSHRMYTAWNYRQEIADLNRQSEEGWQLVKGGCFNSVFEEDDRQVYRYQLDYHAGVENRMRYLETFREQGWEYINSTFNGWHYFRKPYDPSLPEEEYEIYTDDSAVPDMVKRWQRLDLILMAFMTVCLAVLVGHMVQKPKWTWVPLILLYLIFIGIMGSGYIKMRRYRLQQDGQSTKSSAYSGLRIWICAGMFVICMVSGVLLAEKRPNIQNISMAEEYSIEDKSGKISANTFNVYYEDYYYLDLSMDNEPALTLKIVDENGQIVYSNNEASVSIEAVQLRLKKGKYEIFLENAEPVDSGRMHIEYSVN